MSLPRDLARQVRRLDESELRRLLILVRGLLLASEGPAIELDDVPGMPTVTYRQQTVRCGKDCQRCPHGPYWYAYWREDGRQRSQYVGSELPGEVRRKLEAAGGGDGDTDELAGVTPLRPEAGGAGGR